MGLETGTYIDSLNSANPLGSDPKSAGDDHIRLLKATIKATFPNITGALTATHTQLNYVTGVTSAIQTQLDGKQAAGSYQPLDDQLTTLAGITAQQATDLAAVSTFMGTVLNDADAATARATLGAGTGNGNGTVTGVTGTAPVVSSGGTTPAISMPAASAGANGYMTSTYAAKLDGIAAGANVGVSTDVGNLGVGMFAQCASTSSVAAGATTAGSSLNVYRLDTSTGNLVSGAVPSGTWRNVGGSDSSPGISIGGLFQRIA